MDQIPDNFLEKIFSVSIQRNRILRSNDYGLDNFLTHFTQSPGKRMLCESSIRYHRIYMRIVEIIH
jgi:hypothetical protein